MSSQRGGFTLAWC